MKYLLRANQNDVMKDCWDLVWYDDLTKEITEETIWKETK